MPLIQELNADDETTSTTSPSSNGTPQDHLNSGAIVPLGNQNASLGMQSAASFFELACRDNNAAQLGKQIVAANNAFMQNSSASSISLMGAAINPIGAICGTVGKITDCINNCNVQSTYRTLIVETNQTERKKVDVAGQMFKHECERQEKFWSETCEVKRREIARERDVALEKERTKQNESNNSRKEACTQMMARVAECNINARKQVELGRQALEGQRLKTSENIAGNREQTKRHEATVKADVDKHVKSKDTEVELLKERGNQLKAFMELQLKTAQEMNRSRQQRGNDASSSSNSSNADASFYQQFFSAQWQQFNDFNGTNPLISDIGSAHQSAPEGRQNQQQTRASSFEAALIIRCVKLLNSTASSPSNSASSNESMDFTVLLEERFLVREPNMMLFVEVKKLIVAKGHATANALVPMQKPLAIRWDLNAQNADQFTQHIAGFLTDNEWNLSLLTDMEGAVDISNDASGENEPKIEHSTCYIVEMAILEED